MSAATSTRANANRPLRCWLIGLLNAWVIMIFGSSALIVLFGVPNAMTRSGVGHFANPIAATLRVADEMAPAAKLLLIAIFAILLWFAEQYGSRHTTAAAPPKPDVSSWSRPRWTTHAVNGSLGIVAMLLTLALVPAPYSRGFGVGLTGTRFDPVVLPLYLVSAALGAFAYTVSVTRCRAAAAGQKARDAVVDAV